MKEENNSTNEYLIAHKKVKRLRGFYLHLFAFVLTSVGIVVTFLFFNLFEQNNFLRWLVATIIATWAVVLLIHGWSILGTRLLFNKDWEDKKMQEYLNDEDEVWE